MDSNNKKQPKKLQQQQQQQQQAEQQEPLKKQSSDKKISKREKIEQQIQRESQILQAAFACGVVGSVLFLISYSSEYWVFVTLGKTEQKEDTERGGKYLKTGHYHGLWRFCRNEIWPGEGNQSTPTIYCRRMTFDVLPNTKTERIEVETKMAGASCWVVSEVFRQSMLYEERSMKEHVKEFSEIKFGWSYYLVWVSLVAFVLPGLALLYYSRKKKGAKARSIREANENEPVHLGRI
ncbi:hypothetical protein HELRODRAFT_180276 [Helobdella robusta]|uniref:Uncharacterized protein n=1 Tax=Helobdella robusta TaxID=6412 RepID=T1FFN8_HELRO|nr:hypothetical protein HELRODRAFT_180276 [Helobdella robusta]ESN94107.1 hypothetical protein HELRODRAFT_180276 [Helobdella robusta]